MTDSTTPKKLTKTNQTLAESASLNFWKTRNMVGKKLMTQTLPPPVQKQIIARLAEEGRPVDGVRFIVDLFGAYQKKFKDACIAPGAAIHTYTDTNTMQYRENDPTRLVYVHRALQYETEVDELIKRRLEQVQEFAVNYADYCQAGRDAVDHNFPFTVHHGGSTVPVSALLKYPTKREFIEAFYAERTPFEPLATFEAEKYASLPAAFVTKHARIHDAAIVAQMDAVKEKALESVKISMDLIGTQLARGERLHESLLDKAKLAAQNLREIADGYNNSQMLRALASTIEDRITAQAKSWESFKENPQAKAKAARAANAVSKKLGQIGKPAPAKTKPAPVKSATKGRPAGGGLLAKKKARQAKCLSS